MVNNSKNVTSHQLGVTRCLVGLYVLLVVGTLLALVVMSAVAPRLATSEAWGHEIIVAILAIVLPLRLRAARRGSPQALRVVGIIAIVLVIVNIVEAAIPGFVPVWMRIEMIAIAVLMAVVAALTLRRRPEEGG